MSSKKYWGEIPKENEDTFIPNVSADIERSMNKFCLAEFESDNYDALQKTQQIFQPSMDPLMLYAITLHKHANDTSEMIRVAELAIECNVKLPQEADVPPMPELEEIKKRHNRNCLNFVPKEFTPFSIGCDVDLPELSSAVVQQILSKCIATMFAHIGYETTHQSILDILTDVLDAFLKKICYRFKLAMDDEEKDQFFGFTHVAERVLTEIGMGGVKGLHDYYNTRVIKYISVLQKRCKKLHEHYDKILIPKSLPQMDINNKLVHVKVEEEDVTEVDNPEVHLSGIGGELVLSSLETGYQLLNSLEAEANLQTLSEEDMNMTLQNVSTPEIDVSSNLSPYNKIKRLKC